MRKIIISLWIGVMLVVASIPVEGQSSDACAPMTEHWSAAMGFTIGRPFFRYAPYTGQVVIMEGKRRKDVQVVETGLEADHFYGEISPDCRYLAAMIALPDGMSQVVAWDLLTNSRASTIENAPSAYRFDWSPDGDYAIAETHDGAYLWNIPANQWLFLNAPGHEGNFYSYFTWDMARGQLLAVPGNEGYKVHAYNLATGQVAAAYDTGTLAAPVSYTLSDDRSMIAVFTAEDERFRDRRPSGLAVWNRDTGVQIKLNPAMASASWVSQLHFSPDSRYLVVARDSIRIWDLGNVSADGLPTYQYDGPEARIGTVRFVDGDTIETMSVTGDSIIGTYWLRWTLSTGEFLHAYDQPRDRIVQGFRLN